jgi:hypothetical protein
MTPRVEINESATTSRDPRENRCLAPKNDLQGLGHYRGAGHVQAKVRASMPFDHRAHGLYDSQILVSRQERRLRPFRSEILVAESREYILVDADGGVGIGFDE